MILNRTPLYFPIDFMKGFLKFQAFGSDVFINITKLWLIRISISGKLQDQCGQALLRNLFPLTKTEADHYTRGTRGRGKETTILFLHICHAQLCTQFPFQPYMQGVAYVLVRLSKPVHSLIVISQKNCFMFIDRFLSNLFMSIKYSF